MLQLQTIPLLKKTNGIVVSKLKGVEIPERGQGEYGWVPKSWIKSVKYNADNTIKDVIIKNNFGIKYGQFGAKGTSKLPQETIISYLGKGNAEEVVIIWAVNTDEELIILYGDSERVENLCVRPALLNQVGQKKNGALTEVYSLKSLSQFLSIREKALFPEKRNKELINYIKHIGIQTPQEYELHSQVDITLPNLNQLNENEWEYFSEINPIEYLTYKHIRTKKDNSKTHFNKLTDEKCRLELYNEITYIQNNYNKCFDFGKKHSKGYGVNLAKETKLFQSNPYQWVIDNKVKIQSNVDGLECINSYLDIFNKNHVEKIKGFERIFKEKNKNNVWHTLFRPTEGGYTQMNASRTWDEIKNIIQNSKEEVTIVIHDGIGNLEKGIKLNNKYIKWPYDNLFTSDKHFIIPATRYVKF